MIYDQSLITQRLSNTSAASANVAYLTAHFDLLLTVRLNFCVRMQIRLPSTVKTQKYICQ